MAERCQDVVIGGGAIGVSCAEALATAGRDVVLLEQHAVASGCSHGKLIAISIPVTALNLADSPPFVNSFAGLLDGSGLLKEPRRWAYAERGAKRFFVRTQNWKLYNNGRLFHVAVDVNEKTPVTRAPASAASDIRLLKQALATIDTGHAFPK